MKCTLFLSISWEFFESRTLNSKSQRKENYRKMPAIPSVIVQGHLLKICHVETDKREIKRPLRVLVCPIRVRLQAQVMGGIQSKNSKQLHSWNLVICFLLRFPIDYSVSAVCKSIFCKNDC